MNTYIYMLRHGEVNNPRHILYGRLPKFGLTEKGSKEIEESAHFLKTKQIDMIFASPMRRAQQTAGIISEKLGIRPVHIARLVIELRTSYQGTPMRELSPTQEEVYHKPKAKTDETIPQIAERMEKFVRRMLRAYPGKHIAIVSHGDPLMCLQAKIMGLPMNFEGIRTGPYIKHGEVWQVTVDANDKLILEKVFEPNLRSS